MKPLYPVWNAAVEHVMGLGVGFLDIPARTVNSLEDEEILTVYDMLLRSWEELFKIPNVGEKSFGKVRAALRRRGFRENLRDYDQSSPLYRMYSGCFPVADDPTDLVAETEAVDLEEGAELLSYKQALDRTVAQLRDMQTNFGKTSKYRQMLEWIIYYAENRLPEPKE